MTGNVDVPQPYSFLGLTTARAIEELENGEIVDPTDVLLMTMLSQPERVTSAQRHAAVEHAITSAINPGSNTPVPDLQDMEMDNGFFQVINRKRKEYFILSALEAHGPMTHRALLENIMETIKNDPALMEEFKVNLSISNVLGVDSHLAEQFKTVMNDMENEGLLIRPHKKHDADEYRVGYDLVLLPEQFDRK